MTTPTPTTHRRRYTLSVSAGAYEQIRREAEERNMSISQVAEERIRRAIDRAASGN